MEGESMKPRRRRVSITGPECRGLRALALALAAGLLLGGCVSSRVAPPPAPELLLLEAGTLQIPPGCEPARGAVYRTAFVVQTDGRVDAVASESGSGCVQEAVRRWVATFQYRPVAAPTAAVLDWMEVTATRGG
jgi:hypothetical protein